MLDPLTDELADPERPGTPYDGVWASACLLHVARADLPVVLGRLAAATRPGGVLGLSVKEGDGGGLVGARARDRSAEIRLLARRSAARGARKRRLESRRDRGSRRDAW